VSGPEITHRSRKAQKRSIDRIPIDPGSCVVLAVDVVVALLGTAKLVAMRDQRNTLRKKQSGKEIPLLASAQGVDLRIVGGTLHPAVPRPVVALAIPVVLAVGLVVLFVVGHQIPQRETTMPGYKVDARAGPPAGAIVEIR
jgi:hypothetical protein